MSSQRSASTAPTTTGSGSSTIHSGVPDAPLLERLELDGRRRVGGVPARGPGVDPAADGRDLRVGQRRVLLEPLDADVALDEPRRHLALRGLVADGPRPRPHLLVGQQRHRGHGARTMALLAGSLQDGQHVASVNVTSASAAWPAAAPAGARSAPPATANMQAPATKPPRHRLCLAFISVLPLPGRFRAIRRAARPRARRGSEHSPSGPASDQPALPRRGHRPPVRESTQGRMG